MDTTLDVRGVSLRFGGVRALTDVSFTIRDGELFSIIGPNGAGKTSMVNCISGRYRPTEGQLFYRGRDITSLNPNASHPLEGISMNRLQIDDIEPLRAEIAAFLNSIENDVIPPITGEDGRRALVLATGVLERIGVHNQKLF